MSLRRKMTLQIGAMIVALLLISAAAMWGINGLNQDYGVALAGYRDLRLVYGEVGAHLTAAKAMLPERVRAAEQTELAWRKLQLSLSRERGDAADEARDRAAEEAIRTTVEAALAQLKSPPGPAADTEQARADMAALDKALMQLRDFSKQLLGLIRERQKAAAAKRTRTLLALGTTCAIVMAGAILLGALQYRSVMLPLRRLGAGVRRIAAGQFKQRLQERGSDEFAALAGDFNRMAGELDEFYHRLEEKVQQKSKELIRSERLASVGYLAAGVAHEINNPLGIIAGYAEYSLSQMSQPRSPQQEELAKSLQVICDEAFRCKDITGKLLSLARPGETARRRVNLASVAAEVAAAVGGLGDYRDRKLTVKTDGDGELSVRAVEAEMKQVVLNLTVNALEAVGSGGQVRIDLARNDGWIELRVRDNGRGMSPQTVERVFEPFYTEKRGAHKPGTGLGLSITNAIVTSYGGRITARSDGPGQGSEFIVQMPVWTDQQAQSPDAQGIDA